MQYSTNVYVPFGSSWQKFFVRDVEQFLTCFFAKENFWLPWSVHFDFRLVLFSIPQNRRLLPCEEEFSTSFEVLLENEENQRKNLVPKESVSSHSHMNYTKILEKKKVFKYVELLLNSMALPYNHNSLFVSPD